MGAGFFVAQGAQVLVVLDFGLHQQSVIGGYQWTSPPIDKFPRFTNLILRLDVSLREPREKDFDEAGESSGGGGLLEEFVFHGLHAGGFTMRINGPAGFPWVEGGHSCPPCQ